jgi:hypothetical protein
MVRREDGLPDNINFGAGTALLHNPGVTLLWFANTYEVERHPEGYLFHFLTRPRAAEWWTEGRPATREEVLAAIDRGLPLLREQAMTDDGLPLLESMTKEAMRLLPTKWR